MLSITARLYSIVFFSFFIGFLLSVVPLPSWALWFRPPWIALLVIYWSMMFPERIGLGVAFLLGLILDQLTGSVLGEHALALVLIAYIAALLHLQLRISALVNQLLIVFFLTALYQLVLVLTQGALGQLGELKWVYLPVISSVFFWPWVYFILRDIRQRNHIGLYPNAR